MDYTEKRKINYSGSGQLFQNKTLEKLTKSHFSIPLTIHVIIIGFLSYWAITQININPLSFGLIYFGGLISWTLGEYLIHRYLFHMDEDKKWKRWIAYTFHGIHHEYPKDKDRIVMPPIGALLIASIIFGIIWLIMQEYAFAFAPGFLTGYMIYAFIHYAIHAFQPPKNIFKWLWIYHSIHHYKHPDLYYGVSSPIWDFVFRTIPNKKKQ